MRVTWLFHSFELIEFRALVDIVHTSPGFSNLDSTMEIQCDADLASGTITIVGDSVWLGKTEVTARLRLSRFPTTGNDELVRAGFFESSALPRELDEPPRSVLKAEVMGEPFGELILLGSIAAWKPFRDGWIQHDDPGYLLFAQQVGWIQDSGPADRASIEELGFKP